MISGNYHPVSQRPVIPDGWDTSIHWAAKDGRDSFNKLSAPCLSAAKLGWAHSKYNWGVLPCSGQVDPDHSTRAWPSSLEVLQIFEISWLGNQSTDGVADAVVDWRAESKLIVCANYGTLGTFTGH